MKMEEIHMKREKGITLIALVVTIVVLIILAGVSISMLTGENGIVNRASEAKEENEISTEKEMVTLSYNACRTQNNYEGIVTRDKMQEELDNLAGEGKTTVEADGENLVIEFTDSKRVYTINQNGEISEGGGIEKVEDSTPGILDGEGTIYKKDKSKIKFEKEDIIFINKKEIYYWEGNFTLAIICNPAWTKKNNVNCIMSKKGEEVWKKVYLIMVFLNLYKQKENM